jgi:hypothetical protein
VTFLHPRAGIGLTPRLYWKPIELRARIAEAERAIFVRYLELRTPPDSQEQSLDLERAVSELLELKRLKVVAETQQNFLS